jgi:hypothetical protein
MAIILSGFGDKNANGTYNELGTHDGYPYYEKTTKDYIIIYRLENGPYSFAPAYWIEKVTDIHGNTSGPVPFFTPKYKSTDTNALSATWIAIGDSTSGETTIGTVRDESSSSSSIDSSSSTSESSSSSTESSSSSTESSSSSTESSTSSEGYSESSSS